MSFVLATEKKWHTDLFLQLKERLDESWYCIDSKFDFTFEKISEINPVKIFIPHWSHIIPSEIYENFECIVFHMTDLPFGRGGSPLQNLIVRGYKETMISALKVEKGIDTGEIYLKSKLSLQGNATNIFERASSIIKEMIEEIIRNNIQPLPQLGIPVIFKRRKVEDGNIKSLEDITQVYDYIRMLDCEGYPNAFLETECFRFEFNNASASEDNKSISANVRIIKK